MLCADLHQLNDNCMNEVIFQEVVADCVFLGSYLINFVNLWEEEEQGQRRTKKTKKKEEAKTNSLQDYFSETFLMIPDSLPC